MQSTLIYPVGTTDACRYASHFLQDLGFSLTDHPTPEITHLLLDIPSFLSDGTLRCGIDLKELLYMLPENITVIGGNLQNPLLKEYHRFDFLHDPVYLAQNAAITADCAVRVAAPFLKTSFRDTQALVLGWGRIGKCLARLLRNMGFSVSVAARSIHDRALLNALNYRSLDFSELHYRLPACDLIFNTVPAPVLDHEALSVCKNCVKIELASNDGIKGSDVIIARGLPGKYAPVSSGRLIADTFYRLWKEDSK